MNPLTIVAVSLATITVAADLAAQSPRTQLQAEYDRLREQRNELEARVEQDQDTLAQARRDRQDALRAAEYRWDAKIDALRFQIEEHRATIEEHKDCEFVRAVREGRRVTAADRAGHLRAIEDASRALQLLTQELSRTETFRAMELQRIETRAIGDNTIASRIESGRSQLATLSRRIQQLRDLLER